MFPALCNGVTIQRDSYVIGLHSDGCKESKCILVVVVLGSPLLDGIERLCNLFICGARDVNVIVGTEDNVVAEPVI